MLLQVHDFRAVTNAFGLILCDLLIMNASFNWKHKIQDDNEKEMININFRVQISLARFRTLYTHIMELS